MDDLEAAKDETFARVRAARVRSAGSSKNLKDKKLASKLRMGASDQWEAANRVAANVVLQTSEPGMLQPETEDERTRDVTQQELRSAVPAQAARKSFGVALPASAPYRLDYTRNGRTVLLGGHGARGASHLAMVDALKLKVRLEFDPAAPTRDVAFLHNRTMFAAAHDKYVHVYDDRGTELHVMRKHQDVNRLQFLPFHFLLASVGNAGYLKYQDVSTGDLVAECRTRLGSCAAMRQNPRSAVLALGHLNGTVTLWSPNLTDPLARVFCHQGRVLDLAIDCTGNYMVTTGIDSKVKIFDIRNFRALAQFHLPRPGYAVDVSQRGMTAVAFGPRVHVYSKAAMFGDGSSSSPATGSSRTQSLPEPYLTHLVVGETVNCARFAPYDDVLGLGHSGGFASILVPGAGEPNFDSFVASPFESKKQRQEAEVRAVLEKLPASMITLHGNVVGAIARRPDEQARAQREAQRRAEADEAAKQAAYQSATKNKSSGGNKMNRRLRRKRLLIVEYKKEVARQQSAKTTTKKDKPASGQPATKPKRKPSEVNPLQRFTKKSKQ